MSPAFGEPAALSAVETVDTVYALTLGVGTEFRDLLAAILLEFASHIPWRPD